MIEPWQELVWCDELSFNGGGVVWPWHEGGGVVSLPWVPHGLEGGGMVEPRHDGTLVNLLTIRKLDLNQELAYLSSPSPYSTSSLGNLCQCLVI